MSHRQGEKTWPDPLGGAATNPTVDCLHLYLNADRSAHGHCRSAPYRVSALQTAMRELGLIAEAIHRLHRDVPTTIRVDSWKDVVELSSKRPLAVKPRDRETGRATRAAGNGQ